MTHPPRGGRNLVGQRDAEHQATCLYYDAFNRLTGKRYAAGVVDLNAYLSSGTCPANAQQDASYSYDAGANGQGRRTGMVDSSGSTSWTYDALDRLSTAVASGGAGAYELQSYGYADNGNLTTFAGVSQAYNDPAHPHAVTHLNNTEQYGYDPNGNATLRKTLEGGTPYTYTLTYDFENRLTELRKNGAVLSLFQYDGDGQRVAETTSGVTTVYIGAYFEWTGGPATMKSYYAAGGTRVAMRTGTNPGTLNYLLTDHLGSTAITLDQDRKRLAPNVELRYYPYGAQRYTSGDTPTSFRCPR